MPYVTFASDHFSLTPAPDAINDILGKDVAGWLRANLASKGYEVGEVIAEDYGYGFWLKLNRAHYWITQASYEPDEDRPQPTWMIAIDYDPGCLWIGHLRARPQAGDQTHIARAVHDILKSSPDIDHLEWWGNDPGQSLPTTEPPQSV